MAPLAKNCRRGCVAQMELRARARTRGWEDEVAIDIQASMRGGGGGGEEKERKMLSQGACNEKLRKVEVGGCSRDHWRLRWLRGPEVPAGLVTPSAGRLPCDVARYFAGWYLRNAGAASDT